MLHEKEAERAQLVNGGGPATRPPYWQIFKQAFPQLFNIFFVFFVTLSIFPAVHSDIRMSDPNFIVEQKLFVSVVCFLTFNVFAMLGSLTTSFVQFVSLRDLNFKIEFYFWILLHLKPRKEYLVWPVVIRAVFLPLFLVCNYLPKDTVRIMPVYIDNDWVYWGLAVLMAYSSGYLR